ncbi:putative transcriptional regulator (plasmid) [Methylorubrum extorquens DM4]|uniref:Transcriptional regulator n=1 Tax=Methylorubrum extorquens (strain DSM 6343 / CIP 106787 / DM4) TaxID=661410 RepID=C7CN26_METED|nr:IclR family transcriptional regulator [Methylorubrum extorquens]CAX17056.1 putative transcriptional regulator [Methylorubrum extorquens DM4]
MRAHAILDLVALTPSSLGLAQIARHLALPKSTVHGLCNTLIALGLLERHAAGGFSLGGHVMTWANAFVARSDMVGEFSRLWEESAELQAQTITLSTLEGAVVTYIACRDGADPLGITFRIGMRLPAAYTATGKAMLSTLGDSALRDLYADGLPEPLTGHSVASLDRLLVELQETRARGYSIDAGQVREGMTCFGAAICNFSGDRAIGGIAISVRSSELCEDRGIALGRSIVHYATILSRRLGAG